LGKRVHTGGKNEINVKEVGIKSWRCHDNEGKVKQYTGVQGERTVFRKLGGKIQKPMT